MREMQYMQERVIALQLEELSELLAEDVILHMED
jgi:hypothetical protein